MKRKSYERASMFDRRLNIRSVRRYRSVCHVVLYIIQERNNFNSPRWYKSVIHMVFSGANESIIAGSNNMVTPTINKCRRQVIIWSVCSHHTLLPLTSQLYNSHAALMQNNTNLHAILPVFRQPTLLLLASHNTCFMLIQTLYHNNNHIMYGISTKPVSLISS